MPWASARRVRQRAERCAEEIGKQALLEEVNVSNQGEGCGARDIVRELEDHAALVRVLRASFNAVADIRPFAALTTLVKLVVSHNSLASLEGIESLDRLCDLDCAHNRIASLEPVLRCARLKRVWAQHNQLRDIPPELLTRLDHLETVGNPIEAPEVPQMGPATTARDVAPQFDGLKDNDDDDDEEEDEEARVTTKVAVKHDVDGPCPTPEVDKIMGAPDDAQPESNAPSSKETPLDLAQESAELERSPRADGPEIPIATEHAGPDDRNESSPIGVVASPLAKNPLPTLSSISAQLDALTKDLKEKKRMLGRRR